MRERALNLLRRWADVTVDTGDHDLKRETLDFMASLESSAKSPARGTGDKRMTDEEVEQIGGKFGLTDGEWVSERHMFGGAVIMALTRGEGDRLGEKRLADVLSRNDASVMAASKSLLALAEWAAEFSLRLSNDERAPSHHRKQAAALNAAAKSILGKIKAE